MSPRDPSLITQVNLYQINLINITTESLFKVNINNIQNKFNLRKGLETKRDYIVLLDKPTKKYYIGHNNFYVITRYNRSVLYADAVLDLSEKINEKK